jgi:hypothetical protein
MIGHPIDARIALVWGFELLRLACQRVHGGFLGLLPGDPGSADLPGLADQRVLGGCGLPAGLLQERLEELAGIALVVGGHLLG